MVAIRTVFHAHNWSFARISAALAGLAQDGYDGIQLSPAQKSPAGDAWYLRYQPFDHLTIEGLGTRDELSALCEAAHRLGVTVVADVVFNHMAVPAGTDRSRWVAAEAKRRQGDKTALDALYAKLDEFPHLTRDDFEPWRDMQGADWDNDQRFESWGNGEWPELRVTANVLRIHKAHLQILYDSGVRGFRFDAVKHMRPGHVAEYVRTIRAFPEACWIYGEVFSTDPAMHREYDALFPTTDFPLIVRLKTALALGTPFELDAATACLSPESIRFGTNHDLLCNPKHLVEGLLFRTDEEARLGNCLALILTGGTALVFPDGHERDELQLALLKRRRERGGLGGSLVVAKVGSRWSVSSPEVTLTLDLP